MILSPLFSAKSGSLEHQEYSGENVQRWSLISMPTTRRTLNSCLTLWDTSALHNLNWTKINRTRLDIVRLAERKVIRRLHTVASMESLKIKKSSPTQRYACQGSTGIIENHVLIISLNKWAELHKLTNWPLNLKISHHLFDRISLTRLS